MHRSELQAVEVLAVQARAQLFEEDRSRTLNLDNQVDDWEQQCRDTQEHHRQHDVKRPLQRLVHRVLQRILIRRIDLDIIQELTLQIQSYRLHRYRHIEEPHHLMVTELGDTANHILLSPRHTEIQLVTKHQVLRLPHPRKEILERAQPLQHIPLAARLPPCQFLHIVSHIAQSLIAIIA